MFVVSETEAAAILAAFDQGGELSAAVELHRLFPGITDTAQARFLARTIAGLEPVADSAAPGEAGPTRPGSLASRPGPDRPPVCGA
jgi:hypothetical protein